MTVDYVISKIQDCLTDLNLSNSFLVKKVEYYRVKGASKRPFKDEHFVVTILNWNPVTSYLTGFETKIKRALPGHAVMFQSNEEDDCAGGDSRDRRKRSPYKIRRRKP